MTLIVMPASQKPSILHNSQPTRRRSSKPNLEVYDSIESFSSLLQPLTMEGQQYGHANNTNSTPQINNTCCANGPCGQPHSLITVRPDGSIAYSDTLRRYFFDERFGWNIYAHPNIAHIDQSRWCTFEGYDRDSRNAQRLPCCRMQLARIGGDDPRRREESAAGTAALPPGSKVHPWQRPWRHLRDGPDLAEDVMHALDLARDRNGAQHDPAIRGVLVAAFQAIWQRIQNNPDYYLLSVREYGVFCFYRRSLDEKNNPRIRQLAQGAVARFWAIAHN